MIGFFGVHVLLAATKRRIETWQLSKSDLFSERPSNG